MSSVVYYAQAGGGGAIKIGWTRRVATRIAALQGANPVPLVLLAVEPGDKLLEARRHKQFAAYHIRGEWFYPEVALMKHITAVQKKYMLPEESPEEIRQVAAQMREQAARLELQAAMKELQKTPVAKKKK